MSNNRVFILWLIWEKKCKLLTRNYKHFISNKWVRVFKFNAIYFCILIVNNKYIMNNNMFLISLSNDYILTQYFNSSTKKSWIWPWYDIILQNKSILVYYHLIMYDLHDRMFGIYVLIREVMSSISRVASEILSWRWRQVSGEIRL